MSSREERSLPLKSRPESRGAELGRERTIRERTIDGHVLASRRSHSKERDVAEAAVKVIIRLTENTSALCRQALRRSDNQKYNSILLSRPPLITGSKPISAGTRPTSEFRTSAPRLKDKMRTHSQPPMRRLGRGAVHSSADALVLKRRNLHPNTNPMPHDFINTKKPY